MKKILLLILTTVWFYSAAFAVEANLAFDHVLHENKVFSKFKIDCGHCHNFSYDSATKKIRPNKDFKKTTFSQDLKNICHECHRSAEIKYKRASKTCYTCHQSTDRLQAIVPKNHSNISWKTSHATNARVDGESCMNCHTTSRCVKCHLQQNDIEFKTHSANFKFFHSVQARAQPQRCDSCHSKSFCVNCHIGR